MKSPRPMRLRTRLTLAFLAVASLLLVVGLVSYWSHAGVRSEVSVLRPSTRIALDDVDLAETGLELEGYWSPEGTFVATEVSVIPRQRRPRLRGPVQAVDPDAGTVVVYGVPVDFSGVDEWDGEEAAGRPLEGLAPGTRVDVTCEVEGGRWFARKLRTRDVKDSDKIKATATAAGRGPDGERRLEIHGLPVVVASQAQETPESVLQHLSSGVELVLLLQELRVAGHAPAPERLRRGVQDLRAALVASGHPDATASSLPWVQRLIAALPELERRVERVRTSDAPLAAFDLEVAPLLDGELEPLVTAYLAQSREDLGDELAALQARTATTLQVALATTGAATLLALGLGLLLWRSIRAPLLELQEGARRVGRGELGVRVRVDSDDELGELATTFNDMAGRLASTTLSIGNLEDVFDSMAAALLVLDERGRITTVNRACLNLLDRGREELIGRPFAELCPSADGGGSPLRSGQGMDGYPSLSERELLRRDGTTVPVSFSAAELRREGGPGGFVCVAQDLTERKRIEARVRSSLAEKELLLREVHHRVKNNMQVISSMLAMQSSLATDPGVVRGFMESQARIRSMALIHEQLYQSPDLSRIDLRVYLTLLTSHLVQSFGQGDRITLDLDLEDLELGVDASLALGLIVNELVSNAFEHAFEGAGRGSICVGLFALGGGLLELSVRDDGSGADPSGRRSESLGLSLVETLAAQLGGVLDLDASEGTRVSIVFPRTPVDRLQPA